MYVNVRIYVHSCDDGLMLLLAELGSSAVVSITK